MAVFYFRRFPFLCINISDFHAVNLITSFLGIHDRSQPKADIARGYRGPVSPHPSLLHHSLEFIYVGFFLSHQSTLLLALLVISLCRSRFIGISIQFF
jgi:hypothetical protein